MKHTDNCFVELQALAEVIWTKKRREREKVIFFLWGRWQGPKYCTGERNRVNCGIV